MATVTVKLLMYNVTEIFKTLQYVQKCAICSYVNDCMGQMKKKGTKEEKKLHGN